ncbi:MAG TPA: VOC family protein [Geminicoccaceae bacterium]|nr:VOC family protein [Geminicoccaceae bacterium]
MAARNAEKSLHHVSLCVSDLARARAFYRDVLGLEELPRPDLGIPGTWLSVGGDLKLHLIENPERAPADADRRLSIADPHFALWISDVPAMVEALRRKGLEVLENKHRTVSFQQAYLKDPDGNMVEFIGPTTASRDG